MPIIASAKKKLRKDKKRTEHNQVLELKLKGLIKNTRREPSKENFASLFSALDRAVKTHLIHTNHAARLKSRITKSATAK